MIPECNMSTNAEFALGHGPNVAAPALELAEEFTRGSVPGLDETATGQFGF